MAKRKQDQQNNSGKPDGTKAGRDAPRQEFHGIPLIVGIGASAGGLEAFTTFFANMPADSGMAFVLVQHLDPNRESMLVELLGRATAMIVAEAEDRMRVVANRIFSFRRMQL